MGRLVNGYVKPVIIVEWFGQNRQKSCDYFENKRLFQVIDKLGYEAYTTVFLPGPITRVTGCTKEFKEKQLDLLLYPKGTAPDAYGGKDFCSNKGPRSDAL